MLHIVALWHSPVVLRPPPRGNVRFPPTGWCPTLFTSTHAITIDAAPDTLGRCRERINIATYMAWIAALAIAALRGVASRTIVRGA